jgi:hypothetical protein
MGRLNGKLTLPEPDSKVRLWTKEMMRRRRERERERAQNIKVRREEEKGGPDRSSCLCPGQLIRRPEHLIGRHWYLPAN